MLVDQHAYLLSLTRRGQCHPANACHPKRQTREIPGFVNLTCNIFAQPTSLAGRVKQTRQRTLTNPLTISPDSIPLQRHPTVLNSQPGRALNAEVTAQATNLGFSPHSTLVGLTRCSVLVLSLSYDAHNQRTRNSSNLPQL